MKDFWMELSAVSIQHSTKVLFFPVLADPPETEWPAAIPGFGGLRPAGQVKSKYGPLY